MTSLRVLAQRLLSLADSATDDDDLRLRKRVGVAAGLMTIVAPVSLPLQAQGHPLSFVLAIALAAFSAGNLLVLATTKRFDRYVAALITVGTVWVPMAHVVGGGITGTSPGLVWAFLVPAYGILSLGPRRAMPWFAAFVLSVIVMAISDPWARATFGEGPYSQRVVGWTMNVLLPLSIVFVLLRYTDLRRRIAEARADELLLNAIPASIAGRLKHGEDRIAESYPETTVLFADVEGFTAWTHQTDPERVIELLDDLFTRLDAVAAEAGIEKLKTIGDSYMAVAGAPLAREDHAMAVIGAARRMLLAVAEWREAHDVALQLRIGLASGPAVGGVIGRQRILFDLWGETVNTASRMESSGIAGRIQVAESTMRRASPEFVFAARVVDLKGLGKVTAYLLEGSV
ncbi:MAG TPA: adenylate/guanylate cyclase domain-containing protein [Candidatus Limnocylindria bacterium]|nr:adenylate/guanylate cyclase domain-containing protein [Candidatus Limnocylindria bacterium]